MTIQFNKEPIKDRIKTYREKYPDSTFIPNWVRNGFNSKGKALIAVLKAINESKSIEKLGL